METPLTLALTQVSYKLRLYVNFAESRSIADVIDGVLDYPTYYPLTSAFSTTSGNLSALSAMYKVIQSNFTNGAFQIGSFLENHDQPRFQSITTDVAVSCYLIDMSSSIIYLDRLQLVKNAMTFPFMNDGIPILYYGQQKPPLYRSVSNLSKAKSRVIRVVMSLTIVRRTSHPGSELYDATNLDRPSQTLVHCLLDKQHPCGARNGPKRCKETCARLGFLLLIHSGKSNAIYLQIDFSSLICSIRIVA